MERIRRVLGIDPGYANTGFGIVDDFGTRIRMVGYGVIETQAGEEKGKRLLEIFTEIEEVIREFAPDEAAMEELFFGKNATSAMDVSEAKGVVTMTLEKNGVPLSMYRPNQIKSAVTGTQGAEKETVERYVKILLGLKETPRPDHAADALAAAITHVNTTRGIERTEIRRDGGKNGNHR